MFPFSRLRAIDAKLCMLVGIPRFRGSKDSYLIEKLILQRDFILGEMKKLGIDMKDHIARMEKHFQEFKVPMPDIIEDKAEDVEFLIRQEISKQLTLETERETRIDNVLKQFLELPITPSIPSLVNYLKNMIGRMLDYENILWTIIVNQDVNSDLLNELLIVWILKVFLAWKGYSESSSTVTWRIRETSMSSSNYVMITLLSFEFAKMAFVKITSPVSIPATTSHSDSKNSNMWRIYDFKHDKNTICTLVNEDTSETPITPENAINLIRNGTYKGIAVNPGSIVSDEFTNGETIKTTIGVLFGMLLTFGGLSLLPEKLPMKFQSLILTSMITSLNLNSS